MRRLLLLIAVAAAATQAFASTAVGYYAAKVKVPANVKVKPSQVKVNQSMERSLRIRLREDGTWDGGRDTEVGRGEWKQAGNKVTLYDTQTDPNGKPLISMQFLVSEDGKSLGPLFPPKNKQYVIYVRTDPPKPKKK